MPDTSPEVVYLDGYWWHQPCADIVTNYNGTRCVNDMDRGKLVPDTLMIGSNFCRYTCETCGARFATEAPRREKE